MGSLYRYRHKACWFATTYPSLPAGGKAPLALLTKLLSPLILYVIEAIELGLQWRVDPGNLNRREMTPAAFYEGPEDNVQGG